MSRIQTIRSNKLREIFKREYPRVTEAEVHKALDGYIEVFDPSDPRHYDAYTLRYVLVRASNLNLQTVIEKTLKTYTVPPEEIFETSIELQSLEGCKLAMQLGVDTNAWIEENAEKYSRYRDADFLKNVFSKAFSFDGSCAYEFLEFFLSRCCDVRRLSSPDQKHPFDFFESFRQAVKVVSNQTENYHGDIVRQRRCCTSFVSNIIRIDELLVSLGAKLSQATVEGYFQSFLNAGTYSSPDCAFQRCEDSFSAFMDHLFSLCSDTFGLQYRYRNGNNLLHCVAGIPPRYLSTGMFEKALCSGCDVTAINDFGATPISIALTDTNDDKDQKLETILSLGYSLSTVDSNGIPLMRYVMEKNLLTRDADENPREKTDFYKSVDIEAFRDTLNSKYSENGKTFFMELLERNKNTRWRDFGKYAVSLVSLGADITAKRDDGRTCLHSLEYMMTYDFESAMELIVTAEKKGLDFGLKSEETGFSLYHTLASMIARTGDGVQKLDIYIGRLRDVGIPLLLDTSSDGVFDCIRKGNEVLLQKLLESGANACDVSKKGDTAEDVLYELLPSGRTNRRPSEYAVCRMAVLLHQYGASLDGRGKSPSLLFGLARKWKDYRGNVGTEVPRMLLDAGASAFDKKNKRTILGEIAHTNEDAQWVSLKGCSSFLSVAMPFLLREMDERSDRWNIIDALKKECAVLANSGAVSKTYAPIISKLMKIACSYDRVADATVSSNDFFGEMSAEFEEIDEVER